MNPTSQRDDLAKQMDALAGQRWAVLYEHDDLFRQVAAALRSDGPDRDAVLEEAAKVVERDYIPGHSVAGPEAAFARANRIRALKRSNATEGRG